MNKEKFRLNRDGSYSYTPEYKSQIEKEKREFLQRNHYKGQWIDPTPHWNIEQKDTLIPWAENPHHLYLWGDNSTGKTTTARHLLVEYSLRNADKSVKFITFSDLLMSRQQMTWDTYHQNMYQQVIESAVVVIDDAFDVSKTFISAGKKEIAYLDTILRTMIESLGTIIVFTSNVSVTSIEGVFGKSLLHLVARNTKALEFTL